MDIIEICDRAKEYSGCKTDAALARKLGISQTLIYFYRTKQQFPSATVMIRLAKIAKLDPDACVILRDIWKSKGEETEVYNSILSRLRQTRPTIAAILIALFAGIAGQTYVSDAQAKTAPARPAEAGTVYIMENIKQTIPRGIGQVLLRAADPLSAFCSSAARVVLSSLIASVTADEGRLHGHDLSGETRFSGSCLSR